MAATVTVCRYLDVFTNNALRRSTPTCDDSIPKDVKVLFIGVDIVVFVVVVVFVFVCFSVLFLSVFF